MGEGHLEERGEMTLGGACSPISVIRLLLVTKPYNIMETLDYIFTILWKVLRKSFQILGYYVTNLIYPPTIYTCMNYWALS